MPGPDDLEAKGDVLAHEYTFERAGRDVARVSKRWFSLADTYAAYHPQGMVKIGDALFVSSVEIRVPTKRFPQPVDGYDRDAGDGVKHLFKLDLAGNLIADLKLGEGAAYATRSRSFSGRTAGSR